MFVFTFLTNSHRHRRWLALQMLPKTSAFVVVFLFVRLQATASFCLLFFCINISWIPLHVVRVFVRLVVFCCETCQPNTATTTTFSNQPHRLSSLSSSNNEPSYDWQHATCGLPANISSLSNMFDAMIILYFAGLDYCLVATGSSAKLYP